MKHLYDWEEDYGKSSASMVEIQKDLRQRFPHVIHVADEFSYHNTELLEEVDDMVFNQWTVMFINGGAAWFYFSNEEDAMAFKLRWG